jgi:hypothetical protein
MLAIALNLLVVQGTEHNRFEYHYRADPQTAMVRATIQNDPPNAR